MFWGFGKSPEQGAAEAAAAEDMEKKKATGQIDRASDSIRELRDQPAFTLSTPEGSALRLGALLLGLMTPGAALANGPHEKVHDLNEMIQELVEYQDDLEEDRERYETQGKKYQVSQVDNELERVQDLEETLRERRDKAAEKITKAHERRNERLEKKGKNLLGLYDQVNDDVDAVLKSFHVQENGRSLVIGQPGEQIQMIDVPLEYEIWGVDLGQHSRYDCTIILEKNDGSYYGVFLDHGEYVGEGPVNDQGSEL